MAGVGSLRPDPCRCRRRAMRMRYPLTWAHIVMGRLREVPQEDSGGSAVTLGLTQRAGERSACLGAWPLIGSWDSSPSQRLWASLEVWRLRWPLPRPSCPIDVALQTRLLSPGLGFVHDRARDGSEPETGKAVRHSLSHVHSQGTHSVSSSMKGEHWATSD